MFSRVTAVGLLLLGALGLWKIVDAAINYKQAVAAYMAGDHSTVVMLAEHFKLANQDLHYDGWSPVDLVGDLKTLIRSAKQ